MKIFKGIIIFLFVGCCISCMTPKHFTNYYTGKYTGLDILINTQGYYYFSACEGPRSHVVMFYTDGLFKCANSPVPEVNEYTLGRMNGSIKDKTPFWGAYQISGDTIKTQAYIDTGIYGVYIQFRDYLILTDNKLLTITEYMLLKNGDRDPDFKETKYCNPSSFHYLETKADSTESVLLRKKWFKGK